MDPESQVRRGLLARTLFETLRNTGEPLAPQDALALVTSRVSPNKQELSHNASGFPRYETYLRFVSTWGSAIGWMAKRGGWSITEAGVEGEGKVAEFDAFCNRMRVNDYLLTTSQARRTWAGSRVKPPTPCRRISDPTCGERSSG